MGEAERRRRQFIRAHRPDGRRPRFFCLGAALVRRRIRVIGPEPLPRVVVVRRQGWRARPAGRCYQATCLAEAGSASTLEAKSHGPSRPGGSPVSVVGQDVVHGDVDGNGLQAELSRRVVMTCRWMSRATSWTGRRS